MISCVGKFNVKFFYNSHFYHFTEIFFINLIYIFMIGYTEGIYTFYVYILTNKNRTVLYTGVTNKLKLRLQQHESKLNQNSFAAKYNSHFLIYYQIWLDSIGN